jgi:hypothetical protein
MFRVAAPEVNDPYLISPKLIDIELSFNCLLEKKGKIVILSFRYTVSALCYSIINQRCESTSSALAFPHNEVVQFVLQQHSRMPDFLRFPIVFLTLVFDLWGIVQGGSVFHRLPPETRSCQINSWRSSPLGFCRDLMRFYESIAVFGWYASPTTNLASQELTACLNP